MYSAPSDYTPIVEDLVFTSSDDRRCRTIQTGDDSILETDEEFSLMLNTSDSSVTLSPEIANVTITNDDGKP